MYAGDYIIPAKQSFRGDNNCLTVCARVDLQLNYTFSMLAPSTAVFEITSIDKPSMMS